MILSFVSACRHYADENLFGVFSRDINVYLIFIISQSTLYCAVWCYNRAIVQFCVYISMFAFIRTSSKTLWCEPLRLWRFAKLSDCKRMYCPFAFAVEMLELHAVVNEFLTRSNVSTASLSFSAEIAKVGGKSLVTQLIGEISFAILRSTLQRVCL